MLGFSSSYHDVLFVKLIQLQEVIMLLILICGGGWGYTTFVLSAA